MKRDDLKVDEFKASNKWEQDTISITPINSANFEGTALTSAVLEKQSDKYPSRVDLSFDSQYSKLSRDDLMETADTLIKKANLPAEVVPSDVSSREFSVKISNAQPGDLAKLASALSANHQVGDRPISPLITKEIANELASIESEKLHRSNAYKVSRTKIERVGEAPRNYIDYKSNMPAADIQEIKENSDIFDPNDKTAQIHTEIFTGPDARPAEIARTLKLNKYGLDAQRVGNTIRVNGSTSAKVAGVLAEENLLPQEAAKDMQRFDEVRGELKPMTDDKIAFTRPRGTKSTPLLKPLGL